MGARSGKARSACGMPGTAAMPRAAGRPGLATLRTSARPASAGRRTRCVNARARRAGCGPPRMVGLFAGLSSGKRTAIAVIRPHRPSPELPRTPRPPPASATRTALVRGKRRAAHYKWNRFHCKMSSRHAIASRSATVEKWRGAARRDRRPPQRETAGGRQERASRMAPVDPARAPLTSPSTSTRKPAPAPRKAANNTACPCARSATRGHA